MENIIFEKISERLDNCLITSKVLLSKFRMLDEESRKSPVYHDNRYAPFYYILGETHPVQYLVEFGFGIGLASGCYVRGCSSLKRLLAFQQKTNEYYSPKLGINNVKDYYRGKLEVYCGDIIDHYFLERLESTKWDLGLITQDNSYDKQLNHLEIMWDNLIIGGTILIDYVSYNKGSNSAYHDFCRRKGREPRIFKTKYGIGVISK